MARVIQLAAFQSFTTGCFSTYLDRDGATAWLFQWFDVGFARCRLSDGSVVFQGNFFNQSPGGGTILDTHEDASVMFVQDDNSHYYTLQNQILSRSHVGSGPINNLWNGLLVVDATLNLSSFFNGNTTEAWADPINQASNGVRYFSGVSNGQPPYWIVVDADTMAVTGNWVLTEQTMGNCPSWGQVTHVQLINGAGSFGAPQIKITVVGTPGLFANDSIIMWGLTAHTELNGHNPLTVTGVAGSVITCDAPLFTGHTNFSDPESSSGATVFSQVFGIGAIGSFMDKNGDLWGVWQTARINITAFPNDGGGPDWSCFLVHWHPADGTISPPSSGMIGPFLNATVHFASGQTIGFSTLGTPSITAVNFAGYNGGNHSAVLGNNSQGSSFAARTGQLSAISLTTFLQLAFAGDNGTNLWAGTFDAPLSAFEIGAQSGSMAIPGDTVLAGQVGGILNIFDAASLSLKDSFNITAIINSALSNIIAPLNVGFGTALPPFGQMRYSAALSGVLVTYEFRSPAFWVTFPLLSPGLNSIRNYCQAYGIFISGVMDTQKPAAEWLKDLVDIANCAPVWNGSQLNFVPRCEVSTAGNGAIYIAPTASGPVATLDDSKFLPQGGVPVTITRTRPADAYNILPIEHINRDNQYNHEVTTVRDQGDMFWHGPIKATTRQLLWIHDKQTATKVGWPLIRRSTIVGRLAIRFSLPITYSWLDNYDLVALVERFLGLNGFPCRLTEISEDQNYQLQCTAEPFYYGAHSPTAQVPSALPVSGWQANPQADPGSVNAPIIFEPVQHLNQFTNSGSIMIIASGSSPNYGGCNVHMSTDGGQTYPKVIGTLQGNPEQGVTFSADFPAIPDPDTTSTAHVDLTESAGVLESFTSDQRDLFQSLCYVEGGGLQPGGTLQIPYELIAYTNANLVTGNQYDLPPTIRRGVYQTPVADHPIGSKFAFVNINQLVQLVLDPNFIGKQLLFKFTAFNVFLQNEQDISDPAVIAYSYTPIGIGSVIQFPQPVLVDKWLAILPDEFELERKRNDEAVFQTYSLAI